LKLSYYLRMTSTYEAHRADTWRLSGECRGHKKTYKHYA
jgi:hypothetical protein